MRIDVFIRYFYREDFGKLFYFPIFNRRRENAYKTKIMFNTEQIKRFLSIYTEDLEREEHSSGIDSILEKNGIGPIQSNN